MGRRFTKRQKRALAWAAGGRCEQCGDPLGNEWHADHRVPWSKGGDTTIQNGQALCRECNLKKGDDMYNKTEPKDYKECGVELRDWQEHALKDYFGGGDVPDHYLLSAAPGSGKTYALGAIFHEGYDLDEWRQLIVVTNSRQRREGWVGDMAEMGVQLMENFAKNGSIKDYHGTVLTYQMLGNAVPELQALCRQSTLVAFDEIHHLGRPNTWGAAARDAFSAHTVKTIGLTGTPFRSDNKRIPFVEYERESSDTYVAQPDYEYDYGDALSDGVVRWVHFECKNGDGEWSNGEKIVEADFDASLPEDEQSKRLWTALTTGDFTKQVISEADDKLTEIRQNDADAGGLVVTIDQSHAEQIADQMRDMGLDPVVVTSDDRRATEKIHEFRDGDDKWIVAVKMISEGVDIKRLRVGAYLSNVTTDLFIRQVVGRCIRVEEDCDEASAWFWFADDPRIRPTLDNIEEMREHAVEDRERMERDASEVDAGESEPTFTPLDSEAKGTRRRGPGVERLDKLPPDQIADLSPSVLSYYVEELRERAAGDTESSPDDSTMSKYEKEQQLRERIDTLARKVAGRKYPELFEDDKAGEAVRRVQYQFNKRAGFERTEDATVQQLEDKAQLLEEELHAYG